MLQAFSDILASNEVFDADMHGVYQQLGMDAAATTTLDSYLQVLQLGTATSSHRAAGSSLPCGSHLLLLSFHCCALSCCTRCAETCTPAGNTSLPAACFCSHPTARFAAHSVSSSSCLCRSTTATF